MTVWGALNGAAASPFEVTAARAPVVGGMLARYLRNSARSAWIWASVGAWLLLVGAWAELSAAVPGGRATTTCGWDPLGVPLPAARLAFSLARSIAIGSRST